MRVETTAKALKVTVVLDPATLTDVVMPDGTSRVVLVVRLPGHSVTAQIAAKSLRRAVAAIAEHGVDGVACVVQGRLNGSAIVDAGISAMSKAPKPARVVNE
jgi:hypothetical protein